MDAKGTIYLVTHRGLEYINVDLAQLRTLVRIKRSHLLAFLTHLGLTDLLKFKIKTMVHILSCSYKNTANDLARQNKKYPYAQYAEPLCIKVFSSRITFSYSTSISSMSSSLVFNFRNTHTAMKQTSV